MVVSAFPTKPSIHDLINEYGVEAVQDMIADLDERDVEELYYDWTFWARPTQLPPNWDWTIWLQKSGRGSGKTRSGSEFVRKKSDTIERIHLVGRTAADVRDVMVEGEALHVNTRIPTPNGWRTMGDLQVGDKVFDRYGKVTKVTWTSDVYVDRPCYVVTFSTGFSVIADENHKWITKSANDRRMNYRNQIRTTKSIYNTTYTSNGQNNHSVPLTGRVEYGEKDLLIHPYVLGLWLGDGNRNDSSICIADSEYNEISSYLLECGYNIGASWNRNGLAASYNILGLNNQLHALGLIGHKYIPDEYMSGSIEQRLYLLKGLMDSDGSISDRGQCEFGNVIPELVGAVSTLVASLGMKVGNITVRESIGQKVIMGKLCNTQTSFRITFTPNTSVFAIERKASKTKRQSKKNSTHFISSVEKTESVPVKCIAVESESATYLITDYYVPTHNSGILACSPPWNMPKYEPSKRRLVWPNGAKALCFSADEPSLLRGPQCGAAWADELASWRYPQETWDNLMFGLRLGSKPQVVATTTPRPIKLIRKLIAAQGNTVHVTTESTYANQMNLAPSFFTEIISAYANTRLGAQELEGKVLDDNPDALWKSEVIDEHRVSHYPELDEIVVAIDPSTKENPTDETSECGIVIAGRKGRKGSLFSHGFVLDDASILGGPNVWAKQAVAAYYRIGANRIVAESNNGGAMVKSTIQAVDPDIKVELVHASRGKQLRAEPVSTLYENGRVHHVGMFPLLEQQQCEWVPGDKSPDRLDACVWALTYLMVGDKKILVSSS